MSKNYITISLSIPKSLLEKVENDVVGKNRSDKIRKCILIGLKLIMKEKAK